MMERKQRIEWIDVVKGYGIILVIMGHCFNKETLLHKWIFSFHMPLFFILSGYCFNFRKYSNLLDVLRDKGNALIKPYVKFCVFGCAVSLLIPEWRQKFSLKQFLIDIYCAYPTLANITSIWYLIALFNLSLILYILIWFSRRYHLRWFPYLLVGLSGCAGFLITIIRKLFFVNSTVNAGNRAFSLPGGRLPLTLDTCMTALVFFAVGYWIRYHSEKWKKTEKHKEILGFILLIVNVVFSLFLNSRVNLHGCTYGNIIYFYIAAFAGSVATIIFGQIICKHKLIKNILLFYGRNSLFILGVQSLLVHLYVYLMNRRYQMEYVLYENVPFRHGCYMFILIVFVMIPLCLIRNKISKKVMVKE